jgi:hypothetical protein
MERLRPGVTPAHAHLLRHVPLTEMWECELCDHFVYSELMPDAPPITVEYVGPRNLWPVP